MTLNNIQIKQNRLRNQDWEEIESSLDSKTKFIAKMMNDLSINVTKTRGKYETEYNSLNTHNQSGNIQNEILRVHISKKLFNKEIKIEEDTKKQKKNNKKGQNNNYDEIIKENILKKACIEIDMIQDNMQNIQNNISTKSLNIDQIMDQYYQIFGPLAKSNFDECKVFIYIQILLNLTKILINFFKKNDYTIVVLTDILLSINQFKKYIIMFLSKIEKPVETKKINVQKKNKSDIIDQNKAIIEDIEENCDIIVNLIYEFTDTDNPKEYIMKHILPKNQDLLVKNLFTEQNPFKIAHPFIHQIKIIEDIYKSLQFSLPMYRVLRTPPGSGKSLLAVSAASLVHKLNIFIDKTKNNKIKKQVLIYCCYNHNVRVDIGKHCYNENIPLATVSGNRVTPNYNCFSESKKGYMNKFKYSDTRKRNQELPPMELLANELENIKLLCDMQPIIQICDVDSAQWMCKSVPESIAYIDEPTVGLESEKNKICMSQCNIMKNLPQRSILLSATIPKVDDMSEQVTIWSEKFMNMKFSSLYENKEQNYFVGQAKIENLNETRDYQQVFEYYSGFSSIPVKLIDDSLNVIIPHIVMKDMQGEEESIQLLINDQLSDKNICKFQTQNIVFKLSLLQQGKEDPKNIINAIDFSDLNYKNVNDHFYNILVHAFSTRNYSKLFNIKKQSKFSSQAQQSFDDFEIFDKFANTLNGSSIIFSDDLNYLKKLHKYQKEAEFDFENSSKFIRQQINDKDNLEKLVETKVAKIKNDKERLKQTQEIMDSAASVEWEKKLIINTEEHKRKYFDKDFSQISSPHLKKQRRNNIENQDLLASIKEAEPFVTSSLLNGIGIIHEIPEETKRFRDKVSIDDEVLNCMKSNQLSQLISDKSIVQGTNFTVDNLIIDMITQSKGILIQAVGRAGRMGKCEFSNIFMTMSHIKCLFGQKMEEQERMLNILHESINDTVQNVRDEEEEVVEDGPAKDE